MTWCLTSNHHKSSGSAMADVIRSTEELSQLEQINMLTRLLAERFSRQADPWWMAEMCPYLVDGDGFPLTGTEFGMLAGIELNKADSLQLSLQFRSDEIGSIISIMERQGESGKAVSRTLAQLGALARQPRTVPIDFAVGTALGESADLRLYVGSLDRLSGDLAVDLHKAGVWQVSLSDEATELVNRLRLGAKFMGLSKRFGSRESYLLYFLPIVPLTADVLDYVVPDHDADRRWRLGDFVAENAPDPLISANDYGWGVAIDRHGNLLYLKVELKIGALRPELVENENITWLQKAASESQLQAIPYAISCGINSTSSREVVYFAFASTGVGSETAPNPRADLKVHRPFGDAASAAELNQSVMRAIGSGLEAVLAKQNPDGSWEDFVLPYYGKSDFWTTAHIGFRLASLPPRWRSRTVQTALEAAGDFLLSQDRTGWGFNSRSPVDADSTAHVMLFFKAIDVEVPAETIEALLSFWIPNQGFATFLQEGHWPSVWCEAHPDVTPLALHALAICSSTPIPDHYLNSLVSQNYFDILAQQHWPAFWWNLDWYTFGAWCRCLNSLDKLGLWKQPFSYYADEHLKRHVSTTNWIDEALLLESLYYIAEENHRRVNTIVQIVSGQSDKGLWPSGMILRIDPQFLGGSQSIGGSLYGTSIILSSLALYLSASMKSDADSAF
jgi:hypothetical protein